MHDGKIDLQEGGLREQPTKKPTRAEKKAGTVKQKGLIGKEVSVG